MLLCQEMVTIQYPFPIKGQDFVRERVPSDNCIVELQSNTELDTNLFTRSELKTTAGQRTISGQYGDLTSQKILLAGQVMFRRSRSFLNKQSNPHLQILDFLSLFYYDPSHENIHQRGSVRKAKNRSLAVWHAFMINRNIIRTLSVQKTFSRLNNCCCPFEKTVYLLEQLRFSIQNPGKIVQSFK